MPALQGLGAEAFAPLREVQCRCDGRGGLRLSRVLLGLLRRLGGRGGNQFGGGIRGFGTGAEEERPASPADSGATKTIVLSETEAEDFLGKLLRALEPESKYKM